MRQKMRENKMSGSAVIEYTIVFPLVLLVIIALFYMGFTLHQRAVLDSAVNRAAIMAARMMSDPQYASITNSAKGDGDSLDFATNQYNFQNTTFTIEPYRYIFNYSGDKYRDEVENQVRKMVGKNSIWGTTSDVTVTFTYKNYILYQEIRVSAEQAYRLPGVFKLIGLDESVTMKTTAVQAVMDSDEFIRNVDLVIDILEMFTGVNIQESLGNVMNKINDFTNLLFQKK